MIGILEILGALGAVAVAVVGAWFGGQRKGAQKERNAAMKEALEDEKNRMQAGRDAVRNGRGRDPADRLRDNDGRW